MNHLNSSFQMENNVHPRPTDSVMDVMEALKSAHPPTPRLTFVHSSVLIHSY